MKESMPSQQVSSDSSAQTAAILVIPAGPLEKLANTEFCGRPLISWTALQCVGSRRIDATYVVTESWEVVENLKPLGVRVIQPSRPLSFHQEISEAAMTDVLPAVESELGAPLDLVLVPRFTSPLRYSRDFDRAIDIFNREGLDSLFSSSAVRETAVWNRAGDTFSRVKEICWQSDSFFLFRSATLRRYGGPLGGKIGAYPMPTWMSVDMMIPDDQALAEWLFRERILNRSLIEELASVRLVVYDFDGVMTNNLALTLQDGLEGVLVNRADGLGVKWIRQLGLRQMILSAEKNPVVAARARKLDLPILHGVEDKWPVLEKYCFENRVDPGSILYVGNDLNDEEAMRRVGFAIAPADAHARIKAIARVVLKSRGGEGVVRELAEMISRSHARPEFPGLSQREETWK